MIALLFALFLHLGTPATVQTGCPHLGVCHPPVVTQFAPCQGGTHQAACYLGARHRREVQR